MSDPIEIKSVMNAKELLELGITKVPMLVEGLIQETGLVGITGSSDVGKSCFLRHLAIAIARGDSEFLGFELNTRSQKVIYVSTEDMMVNISVSMQKHLGYPEEIESIWENLIFVTDTENIYELLDELMGDIKPDCVIIDAFTDIHSGDLNMSTRVRGSLNRFKNLAQKHDSLFLVLNHVGKRAENKVPSKHSSLGSQGFEAKMRMLAEIRLDHADNNLRHLCILKGNYIANEEKDKSYVLEMDPDTLLYHNTGQRRPFNELVTSSRSTLRDKWLPKCCELIEADPDKTINQIYNQLREEGFSGARSTIGNYIKECDEQ